MGAGEVIVKEAGAGDATNGAASHHLIPTRPIGRPRVVDRITELLRLSEGQRVLHLGCVDYPFTAVQGEHLLHRRLFRVARELWGLDASAEGIQQLGAAGFPNLVVGDVEQLDQAPLPDTFDVIVAGELIEHLARPGSFLASLRSRMDRNTELVLTTPNAFGFKGVVHSMLGREKVHPDHNYYFSHYTVAQLLAKFGFRCREIYYYQEVRGSGFALAVDRSLALVPRLWPGLADGLFVRAALDGGASG